MRPTITITMAKEDLIYQLTKTVYGRLGAGADARVVEDLVADLSRLVGYAPESPSQPGRVAPGARVIVSAFGTNRPGVVAVIASTLAEAHYNIADMNQTVVQGKFAMVLIAEAVDGAGDLASLKDRLGAAGESVGVRIYAQREELFQAMHRV